MPQYIAFLRAVNVAPRWVKMAALRDHLDAVGFGEVESHIQSGNLLVTSRRRSTRTVAEELSVRISAYAGFDVPVVARTPGEVADLAGALETPGPLPGSARAYVALTAGEWRPGAETVLDGWDVDGERARTRPGGDVLVWLAGPSHKARLTNARIEKETGAVSTLRDAAVVRAIAERWC